MKTLKFRDLGWLPLANQLISINNTEEFWFLSMTHDASILGIKASISTLSLFYSLHLYQVWNRKWIGLILSYLFFSPLCLLSLFLCFFSSFSFIFLTVEEAVLDILFMEHEKMRIRIQGILVYLLPLCKHAFLMIVDIKLKASHMPSKLSTTGLSPSSKVLIFNVSYFQ
jgi:hypothetical protein